MSRCIYDASALLALLQNEKGAERVLEALEESDSIISAVNLCEVIGKLVLAGVPPDGAEALVRGLPVHPVPCDDSIGIAAARLIRIGKPLGLSLGDRVCLATALAGGGTVLTTEQIWRGIHLPNVVIDIIREHTHKT